MTKPVKFTDVSVFQGSSYHDMKQLKAYGSQFNFVKLTEDPSPSWPYKYVNPNAASQISNSLAVWGGVGIYHFWHTYYGNSAAFFISKAKSLGLDFSTTKVALDVEAPDLPLRCTHGINEFESQLVQAGFKPGNIWTYVSKSWIDEGRVIPSELKYGFLWVAYYPYNSVFEDNAIKPNSRILPRYNAVQFSGLGHQDWSYDYTGTLLKNSKPKARPKKRITKKEAPTSHYLTHGKEFRVITDQLSGYKDPEFHTKNGNVLAKGSRINGQILRFKDYTRLDTPIGWFSTNTKFLKELK